MSVEFNTLMQSFDTAIKNKEQGKFSKEDVSKIYDASSHLFKDSRFVEDKQLMLIRDKLVALSDGVIDKGRAMKKLQGTSRAEAIKSVLDRTLPK